MSNGPRTHPALTFLLFLFGALLLYLPVLNTFFLSDDFIALHLQSQQLHLIFRSIYRPFNELTNYCLYQLFGLRPLGYHLFSIVLHALAAYLVMLTTLRLFRTLFPKFQVPRVAALFAGLLFLVMHIHTESVSWVSGKASLQSAVLSLASIYWYICFRLQRRAWYIPLWFTAMVLAIFTYESALAVPLVVLILEFMYDHRDRLSNDFPQKSWFEAIITPVLLAFTVGMYTIAKLYLTGPLSQGHAGRVLGRINIWIFLKNLVVYPLRVFVPPTSSTMRFLVYSAVFALIALSVMIILYRYRRQITIRWLLLPACFFISLMPVISLGASIHSLEGDRFLYLPSAFVAIMAAALVYAFPRRIWREAFAVVLLIYSFFWLEYNNFHWRKASIVARETISFFDSLPATEERLVINIPDNYEGAYIFRMGFDHAAILFGDTLKMKESEILAGTDIREWQPILLHEFGGRYVLNAPEEIYLRERPPEWVTVTGIKDGALSLMLDPVNTVQIIYYANRKWQYFYLPE